MFGLPSDAELGICPAKKSLYYNGASETAMAPIVDHKLIACDKDCMGAEEKKAKLFRVIPFGIVEVCPQDIKSLQTP